MLAAARTELKRSNRRHIQTSSLHAILVDLENISYGLQNLRTDWYIQQQQFGDLIETLLAALLGSPGVPGALDHLEAAENWYGKYEVLENSVQINDINSASNIRMYSMSCCQQCHDILEGALRHPNIQNT